MKYIVCYKYKPDFEYITYGEYAQEEAEEDG